MMQWFRTVRRILEARRARRKTRPACYVKPWLERLEEREVLATWTGAVSADWTDGRNWDGGAAPGPNDSASFVAANNVPCYVPAGIGVSIASLSIAAGYTKTITLQSQIGRLGRRASPPPSASPATPSWTAVRSTRQALVAP